MRRGIVPIERSGPLLYFLHLTSDTLLIAIFSNPFQDFPGVSRTAENAVVKHLPLVSGDIVQNMTGMGDDQRGFGPIFNGFLWGL